MLDKAHLFSTKSSHQLKEGATSTDYQSLSDNSPTPTHHIERDISDLWRPITSEQAMKLIKIKAKNAKINATLKTYEIL